MLWKILFFNRADVDGSVFLYIRYAINIEQGTPTFDEIKDILERRNFVQVSDDSDIWIHPVGLRVGINLDVDGCVTEGYKVITVDELATVVLPCLLFLKEGLPNEKHNDSNILL